MPWGQIYTSVGEVIKELRIEKKIELQEMIKKLGNECMWKKRFLVIFIFE
jgi:hypothetical protein